MQLNKSEKCQGVHVYSINNRNTSEEIEKVPRTFTESLKFSQRSVIAPPPPAAPPQFSVCHWLRLAPAKHIFEHSILNMCLVYSTTPQHFTLFHLFPISFFFFGQSQSCQSPVREITAPHTSSHKKKKKQKINEKWKQETKEGATFLHVVTVTVTSTSPAADGPENKQVHPPTHATHNTHHTRPTSAGHLIPRNTGDFGSFHGQWWALENSSEIARFYVIYSLA